MMCSFERFEKPWFYRVAKSSAPQALPLIIQFCKQSMNQYAKKGKRDQSKENVIPRTCLILGSYVCNTAEAKSMLRTKKETKLYFHVLDALRGRKTCLKKSKSEHQKLQHFNDILFTLGGPKNYKTIAMLYELSVHPASLTLPSFPFTGIYPSVDVYVVLVFHSMHIITVVLDRLLDERLWSSPDHGKRENFDVWFSGRSFECHEQFRKKILHSFNMFFWSLLSDYL